MRKMRKLALIDQLFLMLEDDTQPMHVGGLFLFEKPADGTDSSSCFADIVHALQHSTAPPTYPFDQVLHNLIFWQTETNIDIDDHVHYVTLPEPLTLASLATYVAREQSKRLDRSKPLWECHIVNGIEIDDIESKDCHELFSNTPTNTSQPFALYIKIHHALLDGVAAMRLVQKYLSTSPNDMIDLPIWSRIRQRVANPHTENQHMVNLLQNKPPPTELLKQQLKSVKPVFSELKRSFLNRNNSQYVTANQAPACLLNQRITKAREFAVQSYDMEKFKRIATHYGVSINDVALALCSGMLRRYLSGDGLSNDKLSGNGLTNDKLFVENHLPDKPLIGFVPTSLRTDESAAGNELAFILCDLATNIADPIHRLKTIHQSMQLGKKRFQGMNQIEFINYSVLAHTWEGVNLLTNLYPEKQAFNIIISNVKGSKQPLYWNGTKLSALYPVSVVMNGFALNITFVTYVDQIEFGIIGCPDVLPNIGSMTDLLEKELKILDKMCVKRQ